MISQKIGRLANTEIAVFFVLSISLGEMIFEMMFRLMNHNYSEDWQGCSIKDKTYLF